MCWEIHGKLPYYMPIHSTFSTMFIRLLPVVINLIAAWEASEAEIMMNGNSDADFGFLKMEKQKVN